MIKMKIEFKGWEIDDASQYKLFWQGEDNSIVSLIKHGPIPANLTITLREVGFYRIVAIGLHELGYTGVDITPDMFEDTPSVTVEAKPELFDLVPQSYTGEE